MKVSGVNDALFRGEVEIEGVLPHLDALARAPFVFRMDFGLERLPEEPGILLIRGARQYGKSTWLEGKVRETIEAHGPGTTYTLNGDELRDADALAEAIASLVGLFAKKAPVRRLFIDEITSVKGWAQVLKRAVDTGELREVLVVTTGSRATDLRRGEERLPGRKGKLPRTAFLFTPVSFAEFRRVCGDVLGDDLLEAYLLSGGSPIALGELAAHGRVGEWVIETVRDWIHGAIASSGRSRSALLSVMEVILKTGSSPLGQARLAREAGLANNTVAFGYVEQLADLLVLGLSHAVDPATGARVRRRPAKFPFINLLAAIAWHPARLRSVADLRALDPARQGPLWEWLVAQELWRRSAIAGVEDPELMLHHRDSHHEIDFVLSPEAYLEVKRGRASPRDFAWFPRTFPGATLTVVGRDAFETDAIRGESFTTFLGREDTADLSGGRPG